MNVSSVKNLNGEVFSAVQDASLTNAFNTGVVIWLLLLTSKISNNLKEVNL